VAYRLRLGLLLTVGLAMLCVPASAQISTSRLKGVVRNPSGAAVPGARVGVLAAESQLRLEVLTDTDGAYSFPALPPGEYTVTVDAKDFLQAVRRQVGLNINQTLDVSFKLEAVDPYGDTSQKTTGELTETPEALVARTFRKQDVDVLPAPRDMVLNLAAFQAGIQIEGGSEALSRTNGTRQSSNLLTLDSMEVNDPVSPRLGQSLAALNTDSVAQIQVVTVSGKAEYSRQPGAQVMVVSRSGGSRWSGSAYGFLQNENLNANDFFNNAIAVERPMASQYIYGFSGGGPVIRNRTFIFGNYEGSRWDKEIVRNRTVLTSDAKAGLFSWLPQSSSTVKTYDIVKNDPRRLGIDPKVAKVLSLLPDPDNYDVGDGLNTRGYRFLNPIDGKANQFTIRLDHNLSDNHRIFYRHSWSSGDEVDWRRNADATFPGQAQGREKIDRWGFSAGSDWAITPLRINAFRFGWQNSSSDLLRPARLAEPMMISGLWTDPLNPDFPSGRGSRVFTATDHVTVIRQEHTFKAGFHARFARQNSSSLAGSYPDVTFGNLYGNVPPASVGPGVTQITSDERQMFEELYNALLGRMETVSQTYYSDLKTYQTSGTPRTRNFASREFGAFLQDDWRLKDNLSVNLGVRFDFSPAPVESNKLQVVLDQAADIQAGNLINDFELVPGKKWYETDYENVAPRVGFVWHPRSEWGLTVRGSYSVFFDRLAGATTDFVDVNTPGFSVRSSRYPNQSQLDVRASDGIPLPGQPGKPVLILPTTRSTTAAIFDPKQRDARIQQYALTLQREVYRNIVAEASYVGMRGNRLFQYANLNQLKIGSDFLPAFKEIQAFRSNHTPVPSSNTLVRVFGSVDGVVNALGGANIDHGEAGTAADIMDTIYYGRYPAGGLNSYYLRDFPQFEKLLMGTNRGQSYYDSVQLRLSRHTGAMNVEAGYTFSKSLDTISGDGGAYEAPIDSTALSLNKARSDADRTHVVNAAFTYNLAPAWNTWLRDQPRWVAELVSGWQFGALALYESGLPFTVSSGRRTTGSDANSWADYTGDRNLGQVIRSNYGVYYYYLDQVQSFTTPGAGEAGTSGRNTFRGPRYFNLDVSVVKQFRVNDTKHVYLRVDFYNFFNTTHFGMPDLDLSSISFSRITSTIGTPRKVQIGLRLSF